MHDNGALAPFHPLVREWFLGELGAPTQIQALSWPRIAAGEHLLITAPTGSGKTLTAFLWALDRLITAAWEPGLPRVLYVSPLKALNNDVRRNLIDPLDALRRRFAAAGQELAPIRVLTRSGDTSQEERRRMLRRPPEILITTPESLNLLLSSKKSMRLLTGLRTVILDEIHAVLDSKRGTHLITAVDRLVPLSGEFQRVALSATVRPLDRVARFVGGLQRVGDQTKPREIGIVEAAMPKTYELRLASPPKLEDEDKGDAYWRALSAECRSIIHRNRSTLLFVRSRKLCEKLTRLINEDAEKPLAYAHHGALSREIRGEVERRLKGGELRAIVATSSLELGIDIGALDEVILVQAPEAVSAAVQRVGRAGHGVGQTSRAAFYPTDAADTLASVVLARGILAQEIEALRIIDAPLDVLAQILVSMTGTQSWDKEALFAQLRTSYPYRHLQRSQFELVLNMLAGRYADTRIRDLSARLSIDRLDQSVTARKGALLALYTSGGTIPNRGYFRLRRKDSNALIGELDEEFVWEARIGQSMTLGTQSWRIEQITHNDVFVLPGKAQAKDAPFWRAEGINRDFHFSAGIGELLETVSGVRDDEELGVLIRGDLNMDEALLDNLTQHLLRQQEHTSRDLPHRHHLLLEWVESGPGAHAGGHQLVLHSVWGGRVNRPYALALEAAWADRFGEELEVYPSNDSIVLMLPRELPGAELLSLVSGSALENLLRKRLERSGFFAARFRECAGRALLLARRRINERMPLWMTRLRSQQILEAVRKYDDFPILLEAWRTCLQDEFDLESLRLVLAELEAGLITWSEVRCARPSPFANVSAWRQVSEYMYREDQAGSAPTSSLQSELIRQVAFDPGLRPQLQDSMVQEFSRRRQRLAGGYAPSSAQDLLDWAKERWLIPLDEWRALQEAIARDHAGGEFEAEVQGKLARLLRPAGGEPLVVALENASLICAALGDQTTVQTFTGDKNIQPPVLDADQGPGLVHIVGEWLRFYGPVSPLEIGDRLGLDRDPLTLILQELLDSEELISGALTWGSDEDLVCDRENLEQLLRMARAAAVPSLAPKPLEELPLFLATQQGLGGDSTAIETLFDRIGELEGYEAAAAAWESDFLPARLAAYQPSWLDTLMQEGDLLWVGVGARRTTFLFTPDLPGMTVTQPLDENLEELFPDAVGRYSFDSILRHSGAPSTEVAEKLWQAVWRSQVANDSYIALRRGIQSRFSATSNLLPRSRRGGRRPSFGQWKSRLPFAGNWYRLPSTEEESDLLEQEERSRDRVRILLERYGVLFRELLAQEAPAFRWNRLFRSLRLMELSGEIVAGCFFEGVPGLQFASHAALRRLRGKNQGKHRLVWLAATDPASLCGVRLEGLRGQLPKRIAGTHLVYLDGELSLISRRNGSELEIRVEPDDPRLMELFAPLKHLLGREFAPLRSISVQKINGENPSSSPFFEALSAAFQIETDHKQVLIRQCRST